MTERQILLLHEAEQRRQLKKREQAFITMNLAFAGGEEAKRHLKELQDLLK
ncbi:TPA: hypothetical protein NI618_004055 [Pseudomonas aeruginosa]|uniref:hypothetical protein n=1 Tax=Pseudomonas TaxID=286 RepID=UPI000AFB5034|nr:MULTISPECIES: hypothetical protein [Pseudomonas]EKU0384757.1 hypothetical protein [Pseudomonas aeruginosa]EKW4640557.1 hypothetical protein [Pseudomonas aeruginosa]MBG6361814.1 hypothetical protein [Pseudomonas aeruginosa]MBG6374002.1 hypothetical protein [Pseudomonas aeruginosa]MBH8689597.1 hypothetical protein [Pseudomonas aeruginosa]